ncbi:UDP-N-acetylglucosamine 1-carboxyvinyltransferase [Clostridium felsineum]|uniref:UDP-N-acetylglucosamine 1-carboxyvinyltransferase n=1 Tax=Clostridium felsineum TaxID=36839 RepID=A0A1S8KXJ6_9CLOT|nr:UDP-N-acetylglucosamine 1-carboxyvinyltransferase [Clostridium felsineum]URZ03752.1 UDP-N-acetylglucosamine 1-carboxyvinyltransferase 1 [Clostridium felsineum]URZ07942.1 UDP-N-acetylglucosamine 1-carboxyvinyltransferase 1 [Clostridium felsineum]URZ12973.1 UDP-N-acetylglucosamine 1-carboxyvinyltransferase 1 [Clostridium felsineum]
MNKFIIKGGETLNGEVNISCAKNSVLPIIAATILCGEKCTIKNCPMLLDVFVIGDLLKSMGADIDIDFNTGDMKIDTSNIKNTEPDAELVRKMRGSFLIMGPMISRYGKFKISLPGGCNIGTRPIDLHLKGLKALGVDIKIGHGYVEGKASKLLGDRIYLDFPSVGATENIIMASVFAEGETIIENAAQEPEIDDLIDFLNEMGSDIKKIETGAIIIKGVKKLRGIKYRPIYDRIETGTFIIAAAITKSKIKINGIEEKSIKPMIAKFCEMGINMEINEKDLIIDGRNELRPVDIKTMPYPGFPTDMQAQIMSLLCCTKGTSVITETIFENRFMHVPELKRFGANIKIDGRSAVIMGVNEFLGCSVRATDLRAGAALILAGLAAEGETQISDIYHIDRGYVNIEKKLRKLGAKIERTKE